MLILMPWRQANQKTKTTKTKIKIKQQSRTIPILTIRKSSAPAAAAADVPAGKKSANSNAASSATADKTTDDAKIADYKPSTALVKAQQYLRGHGVPQNCEQGLLYLHAATDKNDPGAAIQMAALYSSGVCVKQDRVMAYRWFNSAHELQPGESLDPEKHGPALGADDHTRTRLAGY